MFVFQVGAQKSSSEQQQFSTRIFTGKDAQRILQQGVMPVCEQMLLKVHNI
ncbi:MAG: hypothetical protein WC263_00565 [Candidatus Micrarchaeia archaeon]|jgi:hypothetical protein